MWLHADPDVWSKNINKLKADYDTHDVNSLWKISIDDTINACALSFSSQSNIRLAGTLSSFFNTAIAGIFINVTARESLIKPNPEAEFVTILVAAVGSGRECRTSNWDIDSCRLPHSHRVLRRRTRPPPSPGAPSPLPRRPPAGWSSSQRTEHFEREQYRL